MPTSFDIFVGGPMGDTSDDGAGVSIGAHIANLREAIEQLRPELEQQHANKRIAVYHPEVREFGAIASTVFRMISYAELGVLDLSRNSPSVMYELTLMHALGIPVLPVLLEGTFDRATPLPFYLRGDYCALVPDYRVETLANVLRPNLDAAMSGAIFGGDRASNPLTNYFGLPLVDASATTGLATGYYHNFLRHVIKETNSVFSKNFGLKKIVILRPTTLGEVGRMRERLEQSTKELGLRIEEVGTETGYIDADHIRRKMTLFRLGNYIFDTPAPLLAQKSSPMHTRLGNLLVGSDGPARDGIEDRIQRLELAMIDGWFVAVERLARFYPGSDPTLLAFKRLDQFIDMLRADL